MIGRSSSLISIQTMANPGTCRGAVIASDQRECGNLSELGAAKNGRIAKPALSPELVEGSKGSLRALAMTIAYSR
jgi:hypothetical protein